MDQSKSSEQTAKADEGQKAETKEKCYISMNKPLPIDGSLRSLSKESVKDGTHAYSRTAVRNAIESLGWDTSSNFHLQRYPSKAGDGREPYQVYWETIGLLKALVAARNKSTTYSNTGDTLADGAFQCLADELIKRDLQLTKDNFIQIKLLNNRFILRYMLKPLQNEFDLRIKAVEKLTQNAPSGKIIRRMINACQAIDTFIGNELRDIDPDGASKPYKKATVKDFIELYDELTAHRKTSVYVQDKGYFKTTFKYRKYYDSNPSKGGTAQENKKKPYQELVEELNSLQQEHISNKNGKHYDPNPSKEGTTQENRDELNSLQPEHISNKYEKYYNPNPSKEGTTQENRRKSNRELVDKLYSLQPEHISKKYPSRKEQEKFEQYYQKYLLTLVTKEERSSAGTAAIGVEILKQYTSWSDDFTPTRNEVEDQLYQSVADIFNNLASADYIPC